jgi:hypothetical protein
MGRLLVRAGAGILLVFVLAFAVSAPNHHPAISIGTKLAMSGAAALGLLAVIAFAERAGAWFDRTSRRQNVLLSVVATIGAAAMLVAAVSSWFGRVHGAWYFPEARAYFYAMRSDPILRYRHAAHLDTTFEGVRVRTNERGLRGPAVEEKSRERYRVLSLGDSLAFGWGVEEEEIYARRLERLEGAFPIEVINAGTGSYTSVQEANFLLTEGLALRPDLVIVLFVHNDDENHEMHVRHARADSVLRPISPEPYRRGTWFQRNAFDPSLLYWEEVWSLSALAVPSGLPPRPCGDAEVHAVPPPADHLGVSDSIYAFHRMKQAAGANGIGLEVFYPERFAALPFFQRIECHLIELGIQPQMVTYAGHRVSPVDAHPNGEGHRLMAEGMAPIVLGALEGRTPRGPGDPIALPDGTSTATVVIRDARLEVHGPTDGEASWHLVARFPPRPFAPIEGGTRMRLVLDGVGPSVRRITVRLGSDDLLGDLPENGTDYVLELGARAGRIILEKSLADRDASSGRSAGGIHRWDRTSWIRVLVEGKGDETVTIERLELGPE